MQMVMFHDDEFAKRDVKIYETVTVRSDLRVQISETKNQERKRNIKKKRRK